MVLRIYQSTRVFSIYIRYTYQGIEYTSNSLWTPIERWQRLGPYKITRLTRSVGGRVAHNSPVVVFWWTPFHSIAVIRESQTQLPVRGRLKETVQWVDWVKRVKTAQGLDCNAPYRFFSTSREGNGSERYLSAATAGLRIRSSAI